MIPSHRPPSPLSPPSTPSAPSAQLPTDDAHKADEANAAALPSADDTVGSATRPSPSAATAIARALREQTLSARSTSPLESLPLASLLASCGVSGPGTEAAFSAEDEQAIRAALTQLGMGTVERGDALGSGDSAHSTKLWAALHTACVCGDAGSFGAVRTLISQRIIDVNMLGPDGDSLLHSLARCGLDHIEGMALPRHRFVPLQVRVATLVELGARTDLPNAQRQLPIVLAWSRNTTEGHTLGEALLVAGFDPLQVDRHGWTMLDRAAMTGDVATLRGWCRGNADLHAHRRAERIADIRCQRQDETLLMLATSVGQVAAMRQLIEGGATVNALDVNGMSALHLAVNNEALDAIDVLLLHGADPLGQAQEGHNERAPFATTPLEYAARHAGHNGDDRMLHRLLEAGGDPDWHADGQMSARETFNYYSRGRAWPGL